MNKNKIQVKVINKLTAMYPHFTYKMIYCDTTSDYLLTVFRNGFKLKTLVLLPDTPMDVTMDVVKQWMSNLVRGLK